ncbi:MAG: hypothetical protein HC869_13610 [Rhodospirillales bacterium]|nr:hypothetical protein [Rhodospirillales bacterium]
MEGTSKGKSAKVVLSDGRSATFSLEGSNKILPRKHCLPDTERGVMANAPAPKPLAYTQSDIRFCGRKWGTDFVMREHCQNEQAKARDFAIYMRNSAKMKKMPTLEAIYTFCFDRWQTGDSTNADWPMVEYCLNEQIGAAERLSVGQ